jgi:hypothetical protein
VSPLTSLLDSVFVGDRSVGMLPPTSLTPVVQFILSARRRLLAYWTFSMLIRFRFKNPLLWGVLPVIPVLFLFQFIAAALALLCSPAIRSILPESRGLPRSHIVMLDRTSSIFLKLHSGNASTSSASGTPVVLQSSFTLALRSRPLVMWRRLTPVVCAGIDPTSSSLVPVGS